MFSALAAALIQMFNAIAKLGSAAEKGASALDHLAGWGNDTAATFADEARIEREKKLAALIHSREQQAKALAANAAASAPALTAVAP